MSYDIGWIIPRLRNPGRLWSCASSITVAVVGLFSKIIIEFLNKTTVYNREALSRAVRRPRGVPLLTVSNHHSCFDDPGLWGVLDLGVLMRNSRMRWSLAAHDICFTNALHSCFFALGKCVPVVRGAGVYQPAIDFCLERLAAGDWVHIFPEGRVNVNKEHIRFKWGVGRLIADCAAPPLIVPVWHEGLDRVLPNREPYLLKFRKRVFLNVGEPIQLHQLLEALRRSNASEEETRAAITARVQDELLRLRERTHALMRRAAPDLLPPAPCPPANGKERERD
ncbi:tafazzin, phospholipid-lysophospholipid transacylase [Anticarsia gemmatalis]|uniref:tafazzin, phospholipid-lysophospholipid transacylase n=1 Tax=Anticarsia gemmatalis TaxID=129554 RepID=UPI003F76B404